MHCRFLLSAVGLIVDAAMASPCKPSGTTSAATSDVTRVTESSVTTTLGDTTTIMAPKTSELSTTTELSVTETLEGSVTVTTASGTTTITSEAETSATTTSESETTSTAPATYPTYSLLANGGNLNNAQPQGNIEMTSVLVFNPALTQTGGIRTFNIEPSTGRLQDANGGTYVCAYYGSSPDTLNPPTIAYCNPSRTGTNKGYDYLKCEVVGGVLSCTAPQTTCRIVEGVGLSCVTPQNDVYDRFFTERRPTGMGTTDFWYIGTGSPSGFDPISITALKVE